MAAPLRIPLPLSTLLARLAFALGLGVVVGLASMASPAVAAGWRIDGALLPQGALDRLAQRYPDVKDANDLTELLRDIGRRVPLSRLEARFEGGVWIFSGEAAVLISDIDINMTTRLLQTPVHAAVQSYVSMVDSPEIRNKILVVIRDYLRRRGYPEAQATLTAAPVDGGIGYIIKVNEGDPCVIDRLEIGFKLPQGAKLDLAPGDICDVEIIQQAVSMLEFDLRDRGYNQLRVDLSDLSYNSKKDTATIYLSGVLGQRIRYEIDDTSHRFLIDDLFQDDELTNVDPTLVGPDAMAAELSRRYKNRGYSDVIIKGPDVKKASDDEFVYVFHVDPGKQYLLKSVQFEGATAFTEEELLSTMDLKSIWQTARPVNYEELQAGLSSLRGRYQEAGYWDAQVRDPGIGQKDKETGSVRLTIQIEEGLHRVLRSVTFTGVTAVPEADLRQLLKAQDGDPLDRAKLVDFQQSIRSLFIDKGYLYAEAKIDLKPEEVKRDIQVDVAVAVQQGPRVKIGDITVTGLTRTKEKVVRRELLFERGEWYDPGKINMTRLALTRLGLFRSVQISPVDRNALSEKAKEIDFVVEVQEGKAGNVSFGPGWSLLRGWNYEAEASYSNIGGVGRKASIRGQISEERNQEAIGNKTLVGRRIGTGYTEPYIFDLPIDLSVKANQKAEWGGSLWELGYGGELEFIHTLRALVPGARISTFYGQDVEKSEGSNIQENALVASDVRVGSVGVRYSMDKRNNLKFPTDGFTLDAETAWAEYELGGDLRFFRWDFATSTYFGIFDNLVYALGFDLTSYENVERKGSQVGVLPPTKRLYSGGTETVRGYPSRQLGPVVRAPKLTYDPVSAGCVRSYNYDYLQGSSRTTIKNELRYRINESFAVSSFVDNGNVFLSKDQLRKFAQVYADEAVTANAGDSADTTKCYEGSDLHNRVQENYGYEYGELLKNPGYIWSRHYYSYGLAFSWLTPLGALNFAYGLPWREPNDNKCKDDETSCTIRAKQSGYWITRGEFHLNVGARF